MKLLGKIALVFLGQSLLAQLPIELLSPDASPNESGWHEESLVHDGLTRWFLAYVPENLPDNAPVVVLLHGGTASMRTVFNENQSSPREWPYLAEENKFLLLVPNGTNTDTGDTYGDAQNWNDLREPGTDRDSEEDDIGFFEKMLDDAIATRKADPLRIYFTGSSNGGTMSMRAAMELAGRIAAVATAVSNLPEYEGLYSEPSRPVPFMLVNGTEDPLMVYEGTPGSLKSAPETVNWWIQRNNASTTPVEDYYLPDLDPSDQCLIRRQNFPALHGGAPVSFLTIEGGGHITPSINHQIPDSPIVVRLIGRQCHDAETATLQWDFLSQFSIQLNPQLAISRKPNLGEDGQQWDLTFTGGHPSGHLVIESTTDLSNPAWTQWATTPLDATGNGTLTWSPSLPGTLFLKAQSFARSDD